MKRMLLLTIAFLVLISSGVFAAGAEEGEPEEITLVGGTMLQSGHVFHRTLQKFTELLDEYYDGPVELNYELHTDGAIGTEKDMFEYMMQGTSVDFAIISPAWVDTWDKTAPVIDAPYLFKSIPHWDTALEEGALDPIAENVLEKGVRFLGYGGGGTRNLILNQSVEDISEFGKIDLRVQGSRLHQRVFDAVGVNPTPLDYTEVYNAIKTGVVDGLENEPAGLEGMKFYEVAPYYVMTEHQIVTRILAFSEERLQSFPEDLQEAIIQAGLDAGRWHRKTEVAEAEEIIEKLEADHGLTVIELPADQKAELRERAFPVVRDYAEEVDALDLVERIDGIEPAEDALGAD